MPKERVYTIPNPDGSFVTFDIGWNSEHGNVSLAATRYSGTGPDGTEEEITGNDLTYQQINTLIKYLRRARDSAFGRPE